MNQKKLRKILRRAILGLFLLTAFIFGQTATHQQKSYRTSFPFGKKYDYNNILVTRVIDGDTIELENLERVRLIGIDTPEMYESDKLHRDAQRTRQDVGTIQKMGREAYEFTKQLCEGRRVRLELDLEKRDKYGRLLAYVWYEIIPYSHIKDMPIPENYEVDYRKNEQGNNATFVFLNATIIKSGFAYTMTIPPNVKYADLFRKLYQQAREKRISLWR